MELRQHGERLLVEDLAGLREPRRIDRAVYQLRAEPRFERLDASGERGLRDVPRLSRAAEAARLSERNEVLEPFQFHSDPCAGYLLAGRCRRCRAGAPHFSALR